jgi:NAD-dependent dihydropyrimidine dehydrogenase PreA subunit
MLEILQRIVEGKGRDGDLDCSSRSASTSSPPRCAPGPDRAHPVLSTLRYFREEYEEHIGRGAAAPTAARCSSVRRGRGPVHGLRAVRPGAAGRGHRGARKKAHHIDMAKCVKCGKCMTSCNLGAIEKV